MNQVHKVIWSRVKNCYIVVSEITKRVGRDNKASVTGIRPLRALLCAMVIAGCMLPADADAAPGLIHAGTGATASGDSSIAYGYSAQAKKDHSIAQGTGADAEEEYALAMGYKATAKGLQSLAIGRQANAIGNNSIAAGAEAKGYAKDGIAIGNNAESGTANNKDPRIPSIESNNGVAVGNSAKARGGSSVSVGNDSIGNGPSSVAIGNAATANDVRTTAIGNNAHAAGAGSLSIGREASALTLENATSTNPLVTGDDEKLDKKGVMAIGDDAKASGNNSIALGTSAKAGDLKQTRNSDSVTLTGSAKRITKLTSTRAVNNAVAIGTESSVQSDEDIAVGYKAATVASKYHQLPGSGQVAIGSNSNTYGSRGDVAIGSGAETNIRVKNVDHTNGPTEKRDAQSVAIGSVAKAYGSQAVAVGADTRAIGNSSVAIGTDDIELDRAKLQSLLPGLANNENLNNKAPSDATLGSAALGDKPYYVKTASIGTASVALGAMSQAAGDASMAMGLNALAEGDASTAIGPLARSKGKKSIAMGVNANSEVDGGVALGANSVSNRHAGGSATGDVRTTNPYIPAGAGAAQVNAINATKGTTGAVSVGSDTVKRQIINVAAGTDDSDAVNVAQLKAAAANAAGSVSWTVQENYRDVNEVKNGSKVNFADGANTTASVTKDASGKVTAVKYDLKKDVDLGSNGSLTIGNVKINNTGINAGNKQITNVASGGDTITNAANIGDINRIVEAKDKYITKGKATYQQNGDGTAALTGTNNLTANITGLKNNYVTTGSVSNDGKTLTLERNDTGKVNVDLSKIFTEVAKEDYHLVANPEAGSQGKYKADSSGNMVLTVANEKGDKKQVTLTDIASKAQQNTNTTNITNINKTIEKGLNFKGDDATVINKKLGEQLDIKGGADASKLSDGNIGVVSGNGALNVKLAKDLKGLNSVTAGTARMGVDSADHKSYVTGLDNRDWDVQNPVVVNGRAATEDQLKKVSDAISISNASKTDYRLVKNPDAADGNYSVANGKVDLKVEDKAHPTTPASTVTINNIASASDVEKLKAGFKVKAGTNEGSIKAGETLEFAAKDNAGVEYDPAARKLTVSVSKDPTFNSVTVGDVKINNTGINAGNKQITNVASGGNVTTNAANIGDINRIVTAKDKYVTGGTATYQTNGDGTAALTGTNNLTANITGLKNNYVTSGSVSNDGKTLTLERNDTGKVNVDLSKIFTEVAKEDYHLVANPEAGSQGKYKADSNGNMVLTVANEKGDKKQVTLTDIASKAQQNTNTTNITNINNTIGKGLNFGGDSGAVINKKLGEKLEIKGGASADLTDDNIGVVSDGTKLNVKLKKDVNLGADGSLTVNGKTYVNKDGLNANNQKITNVATGTAGTDAVNVDQLNAAIAGTAKATTVKAKDANVTVTEGTNPAGGKEYTVGLGDKVTLGTADKKIVADGTSGKITAGSKVTIDGTTGDIQAGTVKVTGAGTVNELTNRTWDIDNPTVVHGQAATEDQLKTVSDGVKTNKTNITNINNTIGKGLNFGGDSGAVINKKLGEKLEIKGGASADLTDDNIGVVSDGTKLNVKLKKDVNLGPDGSLTVNGKTYVNKDGLNANGQKITNVANGTANSDAVNFGQLKDAVAAGKTILKDGKNTTVEGEGTVANPYKVNVNDDLVLGKKGADGKDGSIGVNGKDGSSVVIHGKDGISIKGKDGKDGVTLKAKDGANGTEGQIGLTGPAGKDGKSTHADIGVNAGPASLDPAKNLSATEMTRLYYVDEKGDHQVATMDDGMKFAGNTGLAIKKLNSTMTIRGTGTKADTEYDPSNIKTMVDADGNMIVGLDKNLKADSVGINGKDGRDGATIKGGDGKPGVDGTNITRLIIEEKNGKQHDIATLDDGMKYGGDTGAVIKKKLNGQVNVIGGISDESKLTTDDNIGVVSDGSNNLKVRLAKDVKLNSVTAGNVVMDTTGFYVKKMTRTPAGTVSLTADGLNNGGNKIANIAAGEADTDAVNVSQLKNQGSEIVNKGFGIKAEDGNEVKKKLGETVDVVGDGKNISTRVEGGRVRVGLKDDILLNSVTTGRTRMDTNGLTVQDGSGNTAVTVDKDGLKIKDGPSVTKSGIDAGGKKITNVAAGEADTDAVNVSQLKKAAASATTKVADGKNTTVTSETNADGSKTYHVNLNDDITLGTDPSKQISIKGTEGTIKAGQVTVNGTAGTVNGLTNKTWDPNHITSGQAATEDQLKVVSGQAGKHSSVTAGSNISVTTGTNANGGTDYKVSVVDTPTFKTVTTGNTVMSNSGLTIKNGPSITQTGVDAGGKRITNVAAGKADTDAVNVGQLKQIGGAINKVDNRINRVGAGAAALAALHPLDFDPDDKWDFTLGYGNYKDAHSLALGAFYRPNEDTMISVGGSIGGGENMVNAGLSMKLGQGNHVSTSKVAMAKEIKDLRAELENVKGALLKVADGRPLDSMDMDKMQLFPDVPENHWAYDYVATLAGNGVIVGYPDGQFGGDRMMTRYEMAALIYRAMQNGAAADDRMARALKEFEPELERIRVDTISKHKDGTPDIQRVRVIKGRG